MNRTLRMLAVPAVAVVVGSSGFAFMATNVVPATAAGEGRADVSGYTISDVKYNVNEKGGGNPDANGATLVRSVSFTLDKPASYANLFLERGGKNSDQAVEFRSCTQAVATPGRWTCTGPDVNTRDITGLYVSAAQ